jgi:integrase
MALSQFSITNAKPKAKPYMLSDGDGLHLLVKPNGSKLWRFRYRFDGKANMLGLGSFPEVSILEARKKRTSIREKLAAGISPAVERMKTKIAAANTFGAVADEHLANLRKTGMAEQTISKNTWLLTTLAAPLRSRPIADIKPIEILDILKKIEESGRRDTAHRLRAVIGAVFRYAVATLRAENDPTYALRGALLKVKVRHRAAITQEKELGSFLIALDEYEGWPVLKAALRFLILTMARPIEVRTMTRDELDFEKRLWVVPAHKMKMRREHLVPLSEQAIAILKWAWPLNEHHELVFPSLRSHKKPLSENAFNSVLRNLGYDKETATAHGFRSTASTICNERRLAHPDVIEVCLAHLDDNEVRRIYNRAAYLPERTKLLQDWANLLDDLKGKRVRRNAA